MPDKKKHHFVPKFYLRRFGSRDSIHTYTIDRRQHFPTSSIRGQCQATYLYGRERNIEDALEKLESQWAKAVGTIIDGSSSTKSVTSAMKNVREFICFQHLRTPWSVRDAGSMWGRIGEIFAEQAPDEQRRDAVSNVMAASAGYTVRDGISMANRSSGFIYDLRTCIVRNHSRVEFITSDNPVVFHNTWCEQVTDRGTTGLGCSGLQILLPLSPDTALLLFDGSVYRTGFRERDVVVWTTTNVDDVKSINSMQMSYAEHSLYCSGSEAGRSAIESTVDTNQLPEKKTTVVDLLQTSSEETVVRYARHMRTTFRLSFLHVQPAALAIPVHVRGAMCRPHPMALRKEMKRRGWFA